MAIQQQLNQLLYSANIGAGFISQSPAIQEKRFKRQQVGPTKKLAEGATEEFEGMKGEIDQLIKDIDASLKTPKGTDISISHTKDIKKLQGILDRIKRHNSVLYEGMKRYPNEFMKYYEESQKYGDVYSQVSERIGSLKRLDKQAKKGRGKTVQTLTEANENKNMRVQFQNDTFNEDGEK